MAITDENMTLPFQDLVYLVLEYVRGGCDLYSSVKRSFPRDSQRKEEEVCDNGNFEQPGSGLNCNVSVIKPSDSFVRNRRVSCRLDDEDDEVFGSAP